MRKLLSVLTDKEVLSLVTDITYSTVPAWYNATFQDLKMDLLIPKHRTENKRLPLIIWICGGAFSITDKSVWMPEMVYYAERGYIVASIEYRTSNQAPFPAALIDVKAAIRYLKKHACRFCIDTERIFVMGESAGGTLAALAGLTAGQKEFEQGDFQEEDSQVNGVIDFYGIHDFSMKGVMTANENVPSWAGEAFLASDGALSSEERASAVNYVNGNSVPFLIFHGTKDETVNIRQSDILYDKLTACGVYTEYYQIDGALHGADIFYSAEVKELVISFMEKIQKNQ